MPGTTAIRVLGHDRILYEGDLIEDGKFDKVIKRELCDGRDLMFSVYLKEGGRYLFMAILSREPDGQVRVKMMFTHGRPEHVCSDKELVKTLLGFARVSILSKKLE